MSRAVVAIISIVFVGAVAVWGLQAAAANAGSNQNIDGESWSPVAGDVTTLDHSKLENTYYDEQVDVYDGNGDVVDPGQDYVWFESNGTIKTVTGGDLDGASSATIDYEYRTTTEDQRAYIAMMAMLPRVLGGLTPLLGVALLLMFLRG